MLLQGSHCRSKPNPAPLKEKRQRALSKSLKKAVGFKRVIFWLIWLIKGPCCAAGWEGDMTTMPTIADNI